MSGHLVNPGARNVSGSVTLLQEASLRSLYCGTESSTQSYCSLNSISMPFKLHHTAHWFAKVLWFAKVSNLCINTIGHWQLSPGEVSQSSHETVRQGSSC
jgi:hypothetical protein